MKTLLTIEQFYWFPTVGFYMYHSFDGISFLESLGLFQKGVSRYFSLASFSRIFRLYRVFSRHINYATANFSDFRPDIGFIRFSIYFQKWKEMDCNTRFKDTNDFACCADSGRTCTLRVISRGSNPWVDDFFGKKFWYSCGNYRPFCLLLRFCQEYP